MGTCHLLHETKERILKPLHWMTTSGYIKISLIKNDPRPIDRDREMLVPFYLVAGSCQGPLSLTKLSSMGQSKLQYALDMRWRCWQVERARSSQSFHDLIGWLRETGESRVNRRLGVKNMREDPK